MDENKVVEELVELMREKKRINADDPREKLRYGMEYHMHMGDVLTRRLTVDWNSFFMKNECPICGDRVTLEGDSYNCPKCKLSIPLDVYDKAKKRNDEEIVWRKKNRELSEKIRKDGVGEEKMRGLYDTAASRVIKEAGVK